jgi:tetratricopeptide (TPR) repeat protein
VRIGIASIYDSDVLGKEEIYRRYPVPFGVPDFHALHLEQGVHYFFRNDFHTALSEFDQALQIRESAMARFDRGVALLALGRYEEGWRDFAARYEWLGDAPFTESGRRIRKELPRWTGEPNKTVVLLHEAGYGDSIMFLRYASALRRLTEVVFDAPKPLWRLAEQVVPIGHDGDAWLSTFDLPTLFNYIPSAPYLKSPRPWKMGEQPRRIGIAWSSNTSHHGEIEERSIDLERFLELLPIEGELYALQHHDLEKADELGVNVRELRDFADVASMVACMDAVVSIDTAALHVAGALGHPRVFGLLPFAATWRWHAGNRWYPEIKLCRAQTTGDWESAFAQVSFPGQ